jgi:carotenoid 1,2-hydratase
VPGRGPRFDQAVEPGGYAWWYVDALSDDGRHGLTLIALVGNVFSPYYARARRLGTADPLNHCALNVALYGDGGKRWALTERGRAAVQRAPDALVIGPSALAWDGRALTIEVDEITAPFPARLRGRVRLRPEPLVARTFPLDAAARHRWTPLAPCARVEVDFARPRLRWSGAGYLDANAGDAPLERDFDGWHWSRASAGGRTTVFYDVASRDLRRTTLALRFDASGAMRTLEPPPVAPLPPTLWRIPRAARADAGSDAIVLRTLEDTPFYSRSLVAARVLGEAVTAVHESLALDRFRRGWVRLLLPFRMPRSLR